MQGTKRTIKPGERINVIGVYTEVMCHFGLAGRPCQVELVRQGACHAAQMYRDGRPFSGTITCGEAGIYRDGDEFYVYEADPADTGDDDPRQVLADCRKLLDDAIRGSGVSVLTITDLGL